MAGHTADNTPLRGFLKTIAERYGQAQRIWVRERGIPTEEVLQEMREASPPISYLVGTPKARLSRYEKRLAPKPWHKVREDIQVKLLPEQEGQEVSITAQSQGRIAKEPAMRLRRVRKLLSGLRELRARKKLTRPPAHEAGRAQETGRPPGGFGGHHPARGRRDDPPRSFHWKINPDKYPQVYRREGRTLLRGHLRGEDPAPLWRASIQLTPIEEAFGHLKGDLGIRPIYHRLSWRHSG